jgi:UDP-N-acetylmuramate--alanine ligase
MFAKVKNIHFVGIGGIGMSGIAEILINQGFHVTGSDMSKSENTEYLENLGAKVYIGHNAENVADAEVVVYSSAVKPKDNPETLYALENNVPLIRRAEMLSEVSRLNYCLAISGTHGKTTTTSMVSLILIKAGIDPTVLVGGRLKDFGGTNARLGKGQWTILEADEFDRSFLQLSPTIAVINNIEAEHLDIYKDIEDIKNTFLEFGNKVPFYGFVALGLDDSRNREIMSSINKKVVTYGLSRHCDVRADKITYDEKFTEFDVFENNSLLGRIKINIPGNHNVKNALAAITVALGMDIEFSVIKEGLEDFHGVMRRFEHKGTYKGAIVIDDYAHHPSEVSATLDAARNGWNKRIVCVFQPHTYTRTRDLYKEFGQSFDNADVLIITDVYPAREEPIEGVDGELIANAAKKFGHKNVIYVKEFSDLTAKVKEIATSEDIILTVGAGPIWKVAQDLISSN